MVDPRHEVEYRSFTNGWIVSRDLVESEFFLSKRDSVSHFKAMIAYDLEECPLILFHAQIIADFLTIEELSLEFVSEIERLKRRRPS